MKAETVLDSVVFQLTPTRTRYDLVIIANGKTEKITSGLLDPFLAHLKTAKDQIAKGGYSIRLEPDPGTDTTWFTKDTVERFVRYVSTPEVLERVNTLELEISHINEAIAIQGNGSLCSSIVEDHQSRWKESMKGSKSAQNGDTEKVTVLSKHGKYRRLSTGSIPQEENSRCQLRKVLESRKTVLWKEQGMAFARATAAGFGMDHMENLILFAKSFGASRLLEACLRFVDLWKRKHKNGQLLEVGAEALPFQSEFTSMKASGSIFCGDDWKEKHFTVTWPVSSDNLAAEMNEKDNQATISNTEDKRLSLDPQALLAPQYYCGQIQNPVLPQWVVSHGPPVSQSYPAQGMPSYQNYPASVSPFQSPYPSTDDPGLRIKTGLKSHSIDKVYNNESNNWEMDSSNMVSKDGIDQSVEFEKRWESHKKVSRSGKRWSSVVVVNNMRHNTAEGSDKSRSESQSVSGVEFEEEINGFRSDDPPRKQRNSSKSVNSNGGSTYIKTSNVADKDQVVVGQEGDTGNWQTFQRLLLRVQRESTSTVDRDVFSSEEPQVRRRVNKSQADPSIPPPRNNSNVHERTVGYDTESGGSGYSRAKNDDFMIRGTMRHASSERSSNPISQNEYQNASSLHKSSLCNVHDESFIVPFRSGLHDEVTKDGKTVMDVTDFHSAQKNSDYSRRAKNQHNYEPHVLSIMPDRELEEGSIGFDPAKDFDMQISVQNGIKKETRRKEDVSKRAREGLKGSGKESSVQYGLEKRKMDPMTMKGKSSKLNPLADAKARAEKLRAFKADLQKAKKEKEEEERKRLEALKRERQKKIAARSSSSIAQTPLNAPLTKARKPTRLSSSSCNGSKFSDATPRSLSPLSKMPRSSKSPLSSQRIGASVTPKTSPYSYKGSKFSDAQPATLSPLLKLLRSNQNVGQSTGKPPERTGKKQMGLNPSSVPTKKLLSSSKNVAQSTSNARETAAQKPTKLYSSSGKISKFTDTMPSSSPPLQKLPLRTTSARSLDSYNITKLDRLNGSAHLVRNESRQSASTVSRLKEENNSLSLGSNAVSIQAKRVSDPKSIKINPASSVRSVSSNQVEKKTTCKESQVKPKPATLSNRVGMSREPSGVIKKNPGMKERKNEIGGKSSVTSESMKAKKTNEVALELSNIENDPIVEKAVLILENKPTSAPTIRPSEVMVDIGAESCEGGRRDRIELVTEHPTGRSPIPFSVGEVDNSRDCKLDAHLSSEEVVNPSKDVSQKFSPITKEPKQTSSTQALYIEEHMASSIEHVEQRVATGSQRNTHALNSIDSISVEQIREVHEKPHTKGSPKGFKELLKFRRKGQNSASCELNADTSAVDVGTVTRSFNNEPTLKALFSKDSHADGTPPKASRLFSLFSPLTKNKSSEKKART